MVYFVRIARTIKIGFTTDLRQRLARLQCGSPDKIPVLAVFAGGRKLEQNSAAGRTNENRNLPNNRTRAYPTVPMILKQRNKFSVVAPRAGFEPATNRLTEFSAATTLHYAASTCTAQAIVNPQHIGQNTIRVIAGYCT